MGAATGKMLAAVPREGSPRGLLVATALVVAAFGPYVGGGIRTEQATVYGATLVLLLAALPHLKTPPGHILALLAVWVPFLLVTLIGAAAPPLVRGTWVQRSAMAGVDNIALPTAVILVVASLILLGADPTRLVRHIASLVVGAMIANTFAAWAQHQGLISWEAWWGQGEASTALNAEQNGRYSGIINQPAEAGVLYGIAMLCAIYLWIDRPGRLVATQSLLFLGGLLTVSKVVIFVVAPLVLWQLARRSEERAVRHAYAAGAAIVGYVLIRSGALPVWTGADQFQNIMPSRSDEQALVRTITAGRFGEDATLEPVIDAVLAGPLWFGYGGGGLNVPYDNGFVEALVMAGVFGIVCFTSTLLVLGHAWLRMPPSAERTLYFYVLVLVVVANLGLPTLTANRVSTVVWLLLITLIYAAAPSRGTRCSAATVPAQPVRAGRS